MEILQLFPFFQELSNSLKQQLLAIAELISLPRDAFYFEEGHSHCWITLVGKGDIRAYKRGETGREITLYHVGCATHFGL